MVKIGKLWGDVRFERLHPIHKLVYLYLISHPSISTLGVVEVDVDRSAYSLGIDPLDIPEAIDALEFEGFLKPVDSDDFAVVIIKDHYLSLSRSKLNVRKAIDEGKSSRYKPALRSVYTKNDFELSSGFTPPSPEEVAEYALSLGYVVNGKEFVEYYGDNDWYDKNNKKVRNWKAKLKKVWCRETNKLESAPGAPKGFEYFYVTVGEGDRVYPEGWKKGRPTHRNLVYAELLKDEFEKCTEKQQRNT
jgi:hypothetical protein